MRLSSATRAIVSHLSDRIDPKLWSNSKEKLLITARRWRMAARMSMTSGYGCKIFVCFIWTNDNEIFFFNRTRLLSLEAEHWSYKPRVENSILSGGIDIIFYYRLFINLINYWQNLTSFFFLFSKTSVFASIIFLEYIIQSHSLGYSRDKFH